MPLLNKENALAAIGNAGNVDEIYEIIRNTDFVDHKAADNAISVFYQASMSSDKNDHVWRYLDQVQAKSSGQIRMLNGSTDVINVLYDQTVLDKLAVLDKVNRQDPEAMKTLRSKYYNGHMVNGVYQQGFWDIPSENMALHTKGKVWVPAPFGTIDDATQSLSVGRDNSVWARSEMPALMSNPDVTHINNISKEHLLTIQKEHGLDGVYDTLRAKAQEDVRAIKYNYEMVEENGRQVRKITGIDTGQFLSNQYGIDDIHTLQQSATAHSIAQQMDAMAQDHPQLVAKPRQVNLTPVQVITDLHNPAVQTIGGIKRTDLVKMSDELTSKHGYTPAKALEAVNARVTLHTAVDDFKLGKGLNTSDEVLRSQAIVRQTTTIMGDSVTNAVQVEVMNRQYVAYTSVLNNAPSEVVQANLAAIDKPNTRSIGETPFTQAYKQTLHDPAPLPTTSTKVMDKHISEIKIGEYKNITEFTQNTTVQNTAKQVAKVAELKQLANEPIQMIKLNQISAEPHISQTPTIETPHINKPPRISGVQAAGVAGFALGVAQDDQHFKDFKKEYPELNQGVVDVQLTQAVKDGNSPQNALEVAINAGLKHAAYEPIKVNDKLNEYAQTAQVQARNSTDTYKESHGGNPALAQAANLETQKHTEFKTNYLSVAQTFERDVGAHAQRVQQARIADAKNYTEVIGTTHFTEMYPGSLEFPQAAKDLMKKMEHKPHTYHPVQKPQNLHEGNHGKKVENLQNALNLLGDKATIHAIKEFQTEHNLKATGTQQRLWQKLAA